MEEYRFHELTDAHNGQTNHTQKTVVIVLSRKEAANLIALLAGQLADEAVQGNHTGAAPTIQIGDHDMAFVLDQGLKSLS